MALCRYPLLHSINLYGGLALFTLYIAYDTQKMIDEYEMGIDDHIKHATDLFIDFKIVFTRIMSVRLSPPLSPSLGASLAHFPWCHPLLTSRVSMRV